MISVRPECYTSGDPNQNRGRGRTGKIFLERVAFGKSFKREETQEGSEMVVQENPELTSSNGHNESTPTCRAIPPEENLRTD